MQELISSHGVVECERQLKLHFLRSHLDFFTEKFVTVSDEHDERFHQDISHIEKDVQWKTESKYVGWLLLESYKGDTNWRK